MFDYNPRSRRPVYRIHWSWGLFAACIAMWLGVGALSWLIVLAIHTLTVREWIGVGLVFALMVYSWHVMGRVE